VVSKFLEGWAGAVIAKILVLVFIIIFIQKRPQGCSRSREGRPMHDAVVRRPVLSRPEWATRWAASH
jgi:hypothetical protein